MQKTAIKIIDSHAHLTSTEYPIDGHACIERAKEAGIEKIINICTEKKELEKGFLLEKTYPGMIYNVASTTPHDAEKETSETFAYFEQMALKGKIIAVGESGFDDFIKPDNSIAQYEACKRYIDLAVRANLPIVFHVRGDKAFEKLFKLAEEFPPFVAVVHCFTGTITQAEKALSLGWYLSISGIATFKKCEDLRNCIATIPLDRVLVETDAPWLAPQGYRGKDNEPLYIIEVIKTIAKVYDISYENACKATFDNAEAVFFPS